jgi:cytochrome c-type biogenesis protein
VFVAMGASATALGRSLFAYQKWFAAAGGVLLILLGLFMMGLLPLSFLMKDVRVHLRQKPAGLAGSFVVGATFAFGWTPCVGPILGAILLLASTAEAVWQGMFLLAVYSLGLAVPFLMSALLLERLLVVFRKSGRLAAWVERIAGAILLLVGLLLVTGQFTKLTGWMLQAFEPLVEWLMRLGI